LSKHTSFIINLFGIGLILTSLGQMSALLNFEHYKYLFGGWAASTLLPRFVISWSLRIIGFACGVGLIAQKDIFRKMGIALCAATILTVYIKHPHQGFMNHILNLDQQFQTTSGIVSMFSPSSAISITGLTLSQFAWICAISAMVLDVVYALIFIFYFTRPKVKAQFKQ
jgi:hypothetical protein